MKLILCSLLLAFNINVYAADDISGIGDLKIGMSQNEFLALYIIEGKIPSEKKYKVTTYKNILDNEESNLWVITSDSNVRDEDRVFSPDVVKYEFRYPIHLDEHQRVAYKTKAIFYKDKLVEISLSNMNYLTFKKLLTEKYGLGVTENKSRAVICQNDYGSRLEMFEGTIKTVWGRGKKVGSVLQQTMTNCKLGQSSYTVLDLQMAKVMNGVENSKMQQMVNEKNKERISNSGL